MQLLSQRDQRWSNIKLGDSNYTIGSDGCTITCLAMAAGLNPDEINRRMNLVGALKGGLVNWTLIAAAKIGLEFIWRNKGWTDSDNAKVLQAITDYGFCLAEVDFDGNPKTTGKHWILLIGNKKAYDPWTGTEIPTSKYSTFTGYAILKRVGEPTESNNMSNMYKGYDLNNAESMKVAVDILVDVQNKVYTRTAEADLKLSNALKALKEEHSKEVATINENIAKEKEQAVTDALTKKDEYIRSEIAKALKVGEGEEFADLIYMIKELKNQSEQPKDQNGSDLDALLAQKGYKIDSIVIKKN